MISTAYVMDEDQVLEVQLTANDPEGQPITFTVASVPVSGDVRLSGTGTLTYTPVADFNGTASIGVRLTDSEGAAISRIVLITVRPIHDRPLQLVPVEFVGHWASSTEDCLRDRAEGNLLVTTDAFHFFQGLRPVLAIRQIGAQDVEFQMGMPGKTGASMEARRFSLSEDLHTMSELTESVPGSIPARIRCPGVTLLPVDEAPADESFHAFRTELLAAIDRRDKTFILSVVDPDIAHTFDAKSGIEGFEAGSRLDDAQSWYWKELGEVLRMGGSFSNPDTFSAPYPWANWPHGLDVLERVAVIASDVDVRAAPSMDSAVISTVSYRTLPVAGRTESYGDWEFVSLGDGRVGYVPRALTRSPMNYGAQFARRDGRWWLVAFVAGD